MDVTQHVISKMKKSKERLFRKESEKQLREEAVFLLHTLHQKFFLKHDHEVLERTLEYLLLTK